MSPNKEETGKFFGDVREWLMKRFVEENIYQKVTINNYQAVCEKAEKTEGNAGSILQGVSIPELIGYGLVSAMNLNDFSSLANQTFYQHI